MYNPGSGMRQGRFKYDPARRGRELERVSPFQECAAMRMRILNLALMATLLMMVACGGGGSPNGLPFGGGSGTVAVLASDQPVCDVSSFVVTITGITLIPQNGGAAVTVLSSNQPVTVDLASLMDRSTFLSLANVPSGTYSQVTFTLSNPQLTSIDFTASPPAPATTPVTLTSLVTTFDINPALSISTGGTAGLQVDFDLLQSVLTDATGNITGSANLIVQASPVTAAAGTGFGELQDLHGLVQSVSTTGSGAFSGNVVVQTTGAAGPNLTVNVTASTVFNGVTGGLAAVLPGTYVEIDAFVNSSGNIVATRITAEEQEQAGQQHAGFVGQVTSVTRLGTGAVNQFTMVVRQEYPDVSTSIPLQSSLQVNVPPSALFNIVAPEENTAQLSFDANTFGLGQDVTVHGNFLPGQQGVPAVLNATSLYLRVQTVAGNFSKLLTAGTDGKTGGFTFTPCSGIYQGQAISALTSSGTDFEGVTDLNGLAAQPTLLLSGQVFFEPTITSAGTVTLTPPSTVLVANKVHQLP
jgi:Domain of unknown function (DUF4382)/Domain of unknown function (DUF5666)